MFYLHPWEIDPDQPRIRVSTVRALRHYSNLARTESRLRRLLRQFRFGTVSDVLRQTGAHDIGTLANPSPDCGAGSKSPDGSRNTL